MILSDLLGQPVVAEKRIGYVTDVRFLLHDDNDSAGGSGCGSRPAELYGLIVSPRAKTSYLGYERSNVRGPWPVAAFQRWLHRGSALIRWTDVTSIDDVGVHVRPNYTRYTPTLDDR